MLDRVLPPLIGDSLAMRRVRELIARFAPTGMPVLIVGPTGAGKDLIAQHIHASSGRRGLWVPVNCAVLPQEMADSLLFGHRRGAFSGAVESRLGHLERSDAGTLFLDEALVLPDVTQVKLLRALEDGEVLPLGEHSCRRVNLRVVAAMQEDAVERIASGQFRRDLFRRLAGVVIDAPPLSEHAEDVLPLARYFASLQHRSLERAAEHVLNAHDWPDNVRELRQAIERAGYLVTNGTLTGAAVAEAIRLSTPRAPGTPRFERQKDELPALCARHDWDARRIASALGIGRSALFERLRAAGISLRAQRQSGKSGSSGEPGRTPATFDESSAS